MTLNDSYPRFQGHAILDAEYIRNGTMYSHSFNGCDLSNGAISSDLERTLTTFSMSHHFDAKYLTNGYRYGHGYYRRRIGNRTQAFESHQFQ